MLILAILATGGLFPASIPYRHSVLTDSTSCSFSVLLRLGFLYILLVKSAIASIRKPPVPQHASKTLSIIIRNHGCQDVLEEIKWENVKNVEQLFHRLRRSGQWLDVHPKLEKECSWKSAFSTVQSARSPSEKY